MLLIEEMPFGCVITDSETNSKIVIKSFKDALKLAESLIKMVKIQLNDVLE
jgi:hypothetical protein